jgi:hypothetical protein
VKRYTGSCHCGAVRFEVETVLDYLSECNCSICHKKGILHHRVPPERFRLLAGEEALATYRFHTGAATHYFCRICGIHPFTHPRAQPSAYTVNVRCLDGVDPHAPGIAWKTFDGKNWETAIKDRPEFRET